MIQKTKSRKILIIDDNQAIHDDFRKILLNESAEDALKLALDKDLEPLEDWVDPADVEAAVSKEGKEGLGGVVTH